MCRTCTQASTGPAELNSHFPLKRFHEGSGSLVNEWDNLLQVKSLLLWSQYIREAGTICMNFLTMIKNDWRKKSQTSPPPPTQKIPFTMNKHTGLLNHKPLRTRLTADHWHYIKFHCFQDSNIIPDVAIYSSNSLMQSCHILHLF